MDILKWIQEKFHIPLFGVGIAIITIVVVIACLMRSCNCHPDTPISVKDSTAKIVHVENDTNKTHFESHDTHVIEHADINKITVPTITAHKVRVLKVNEKDSCSDVIIDRTFPRSDGGYTTIFAIVSCKYGRIDTIAVVNSPVDTIIKYKDSLVYVYKVDSVTIRHIVDSLMSVYHSEVYETEIETVFSTTTVGSYDPFVSSALNIGAQGTLKIANDWDITLTPQFNYYPGVPLDLKHLFQSSVGIQYHILDVKRKVKK